MIKVKFYKNDKNSDFFGFDVSGHSGFAENGQDIVCSAVSSMVTLTANTIESYFDKDAKNFAFDDNISFSSTKAKDGDKSIVSIIQGLYDMLKELEKSYNKYIKVTIH